MTEGFYLVRTHFMLKGVLPGPNKWVFDSEFKYLSLLAAWAYSVSHPGYYCWIDWIDYDDYYGRRNLTGRYIMSFYVDRDQLDVVMIIACVFLALAGLFLIFLMR